MSLRNARKQRPNANNVLVDWIVIPKHTDTPATHATPTTLTTLTTLSEIKETETQPKQQNDPKCSVVTQSVVSGFSSEVTVPGPTNPVPEPTQPMPAVEPEPPPNLTN